MRCFWAIFAKEFRQIRRDPLSLGLLIFIPALLLVLYGYALSFDVKHIAIAVLDHDRTPESRTFLDSMFQNPYFDRKRDLANESEIAGLLNRSRVRAALVIPRNYARDLAAGRTVRLQVLVDGADANSATTVVGYLEALTDRATRQVRLDFSRRQGAPVSQPRVQVEPRVWFNPELESAHFLIPGLVGLLLMLSAVVATSLSIVREKERETMEQIMVSPVKPEELILGKTLPYVLICLVTTALILLLGYLLFGIVVEGSFVWLGLATLVFLFAALGLGVFISSVTRSQQVAFQAAILASLLPSLILSGMVFPIQNMPLPIQAISMLVPPRYFVSVLREIILKGAPFVDLWPEMLALLGLGIGFNLLAASRTRKSL